MPGGQLELSLPPVADPAALDVQLRTIEIAPVIAMSAAYASTPP